MGREAEKPGVCDRSFAGGHREQTGKKTPAETGRKKIQNQKEMTEQK